MDTINKHCITYISPKFSNAVRCIGRKAKVKGDDDVFSPPPQRRRLTSPCVDTATSASCEASLSFSPTQSRDEGILHCFKMSHLHMSCWVLYTFNIHAFRGTTSDQCLLHSYPNVDIHCEVQFKNSMQGFIIDHKICKWFRNWCFVKLDVKLPCLMQIGLRKF